MKTKGLGNPANPRHGAPKKHCNRFASTKVCDTKFDRALSLGNPRHNATPASRYLPTSVTRIYLQAIYDLI